MQPADRLVGGEGAVSNTTETNQEESAFVLCVPCV